MSYSICLLDHHWQRAEPRVEDPPSGRFDADLKPFFELRREIYRDDPLDIAPCEKAERQSLTQPEYRDRQQIFLIGDERPIARVVARITPEGLGCLGFFEAREEDEAVALLFRQAIGWLRRRGAIRIIGPMTGDTWHRYRLSVGPFEEGPFLMEPHNPTYYPRLWEENGFVPLEEYASHRIDDLRPVYERLRPRLASAITAGYRFESLDMDQFEAELGRLYRLSCRGFSDNAFYREISPERFRELYAGTERLLDPELIKIAVDSRGQDAGFLFAYPDKRRAVAALRGRRDLLAHARFLWASRRPVTTANLKSLAVAPEHRRDHLGSALVAAVYQSLIQKGYERAHHCLIKSENPSARFEAGQGSLIRRYRLYEYRPLSAYQGTPS